MANGFRDRADAGRQLARRLLAYADDPGVVVLGLPRGGVPVAHEVARTLHAPLYVFVVRKLGVPGHSELAMGAIASGGVRVLNSEVIEALGIAPFAIEAVAAKESAELERRQRLYQGDIPFPSLEGRKVIVVDDGLATGATMLAAVRAIRRGNPAKIVVAVPVGAEETCERLDAECDELVCLLIPPVFEAVSIWYGQFPQTSDEEVRSLLEEASTSDAGAR